ncbi:MAG TPA: hypothetical protein VK184_03440 [Nostocaceae cyanobacterium]|nr:hypothetical protein [Nostocaceae cyanobacterium]
MLAKIFKSSLLLILITQLILFISACDSNPFDNWKYNQDAWLKNPVKPGENNNVRLQMSEDVINNYLTIGITRQDTSKLLGKPDSVNYPCGNNSCDDYYLGEYNLTLTFDKSGKLIKKEIISI